MPLVSVVMPTRDRADRIGRAVASVLAQSFADFDLRVIDDASTDDTAAVLAALADRRLRVRRLDVQSFPGGARNAALADLDCRYVAFLDSDDLMLPERLARQVAALEAEPRRVAVGSDYRRDWGDGQPPTTVYTGNRAPFDFAWNALFNLPCHFPTLTVRAEPLRRGLRFREGQIVGEDAWFVAEMLAHGSGCNLGVPLTQCHVHAGQYSRLKAGEMGPTFDLYCQTQLARLGFDLPLPLAGALRRYVMAAERQAVAARYPAYDLPRLGERIVRRFKDVWSER